MRKNGIIARNINIDDITSFCIRENQIEIEKLKEYGYQRETSFSSNSSFFPIIYTQEKFSCVNEQVNNDGIGKSEQFEYIEKEDNNFEIFNRYYTTKEIRPYESYIKFDRQIIKEVFKEFNFLINSSNLLLSSRCINIDDTFCSFGVYKLDYGEIKFANLFRSDLKNKRVEGSIFPVVSIPNSYFIQLNENEWMVK